MLRGFVNERRGRYVRLRIYSAKGEAHHTYVIVLTSTGLDRQNEGIDPPMRQVFDRAADDLGMAGAITGAYPPDTGLRLITLGKNEDIFSGGAEKFAGYSSLYF